MCSSPPPQPDNKNTKSQILFCLSDKTFRNPYGDSGKVSLACHDRAFVDFGLHNLGFGFPQTVSTMIGEKKVWDLKWTTAGASDNNKCLEIAAAANSSGALPQTPPLNCHPNVQIEIATVILSDSFISCFLPNPWLFYTV